MPKRLTPYVSSEPRKDGLFEATFDYRGTDGKRKRKTFYGTKKAEASAKREAFKKQFEAGLDVEAEGRTCADWFPLWLKKYKRKELRDATYDLYEHLIQKRIIPVLGDTPLSKLTHDQLQEFLDVLEKADGEPLSASTVRQIYIIISSSLKRAVVKKEILYNPAEGLTLPKPHKRKRIGAFSREEQKELLNVLKDHRLFALFLMALGTGLRIGEILALKWSDINFIDGVIYIDKAVTWTKDRNSKGVVVRSSRKITDPKTNSGFREIPLTTEVRVEIEAHKERQAAERNKAASAWVDNDLVFCTQLGGYLMYRNVTRLYAKQRGKAEISELSFHCLRHSFATNAISKDIDYYYLSRIMGHHSIYITLNIYADFMPDKSRAEMKKLEGVLSESEA